MTDFSPSPQAVHALVNEGRRHSRLIIRVVRDAPREHRADDLDPADDEDCLRMGLAALRYPDTYPELHDACREALP